MSKTVNINNMEQRLSIIGLGVSDLKESSYFYEKIFGWEKMSVSNENIVFLQLNGILLSLYPREKLAEDAMVSSIGSGFKSFSLAYNTKMKQEVDDLIQYFEANQVKIIKRPGDVFWGGYSSYIADPDDNLWEIVFNPFLQFDQAGNIIREKCSKG